MKKIGLVLSILLSFNVYAQEQTSGYCGPKDDDGDYTSNCTWIYNAETHTLNISGKGEMYYANEPSFYNTELGRSQTTAPWGNFDTDITDIVIEEGITYISPGAFFDFPSLRNVSIPNSITDMGWSVFQYDEALTSINLPENLTRVPHATFCNTSVENLVIPESVNVIKSHAFGSHNLKNIVFESDVMLEKNMFYDSCGTGQCLISEALQNIYCLSSNESCNTLKTDTDIGSKITSYTKESGVYRLEDGTMFATPNDMMSGENACSNLDSCKATVLKNKGYCSSDESCMAMVDLENANAPIEYKNKSYASIDDLLKGKHMPKRIYTIDEANRVAKPTGNTVKIKYR